MSDDPIYDFQSLKTFLINRGYHIKKAEGYHVVENVDVDINDLKSNLDFTPDGIFVFDENSNSRQQVFLYKSNYHLENYGKPRAHIRKCQTIQSFIDSGSFRKEYRLANTVEVKVNDIDNGSRDTIVTDLPLCKNCLQMIAKDCEDYGVKSSRELVERLMTDNSLSDDEIQEVDIFGYVRNWEEISRVFREEKDFTCEKCGLHIVDGHDRIYLHTHHINGNKVDNRKSNLQCLCIACHSEVDSYHRRRFSTGANKYLLQEFLKKYR